MRQQKGTKMKYPGIYSLSDGTFRIIAKAVDPKTGHEAIAFALEVCR